MAARRPRKLKTSRPLSGDCGPMLISAETFLLAEAADALRYLVEDRPFGTVVLTI